MNFKDLGDRLRKYLIFREIKNKDIAEKLGFSGSQVTNIIQGKVFGSDKLFKILNYYPEINANWLFTGEGEMLNSNKKEEKRDVERDIGTSLVEQYEARLGDKDEIISGLKREMKLLREKMTLEEGDQGENKSNPETGGGNMDPSKEKFRTINEL